jgi:dihydrofolate reductase
MAKLIYSAIASLDGFVADERGEFEWAAPDQEVLAFVNNLERPVGTYLYGRRMYETMAVWETIDLAGQTPEVRDFAAIWRAADKIVYSSSLFAVSTSRTRLERWLAPDTVRELKRQAARDLTIGGPTLAGHALRAGLMDECQLFVVPVVVGGGTHWLPRGLRLPLRLLEEQRFAGGVVYLRYATGSPTATPPASNT